MRVAVVAAKYPYGNKEAYLDRELRALAPLLDEVAVYPTSPDTTELGYDGVPASVHRLGLRSIRTLRLALAALATRPLVAALAIARVLAASGRPRTKLKNLAVIPLGLAVGMELRRGRFTHVHAYWLSTPATVAYLAAQIAGIPWSSTAHLWDIYEDNGLSLKLRSASFVRAISARGRRDLLATVPALPPERISVLHVGVDIPPAPAGDARVPLPFRILCAANLVLKKGHRDLLAALAAVRAAGIDVRCDLAGDGELRDDLERRAAELGLTAAVTFRGHVGHDALLDEIRAGRYGAMALPSLELPGGLMEGIPVALMEAMALGLPVLTTATGSITELVDGDSGIVVPQGDVGALAAALARLATDAAERARLAAGGYAKVRAEFDVVTVARAMVRLLAGAAIVSSEQAVGSTRTESPRATEAADAAWGQG